MTDATLRMLLVGEDKSASKTLKGVGTVAGEAEGHFSKLGSGVKTAIGAFAGFEVVSKVTDFLKDSVSEARESNKVSAQTAAVLKSTHGAANITATAVGNLATAISNKTGIDDEQIQSSENMLLTFTNVKNEVGKGNDIFNQATRMITDMSVALGQDSKSSAIQLGKALNDPIKGVTALQRVGVSFTEAQKGQIKAMVESGHTMKAQKLILGELTKEFGGSAAAAVTPAQKAAVAWGNLKETIGQFVIPIIDKVSTYFTTKVIPVATRFFTQIQRGTGTGGRFAAVVGNIVHWLGSMLGWMNRNRAVVATFVGVLTGAVAVSRAWAAISKVLAAVQAVQAVSAGTATEAQIALNAAMRANLIGIVVTALAALVAGFVYAYKHCQTFRDICNAAFRAVAAAGRWLWNNVLQPVFKFLVEAIGHIMIAWGKLLGALSHVPGFGWAKGAADMMNGAGQKALSLAGNLNKIPNHTTASVQVNGLSAAIAATDKYRQMLSNLNGSIAKTYVEQIRTKGPVAGGGHPVYTHSAGGSSNFPGGLTWVGERGPELVELPRGSQVFTADQSARMSGAAGENLGVLTVVLVTETGQVIERKLAKVKRTRGGRKLAFES